MKEKIFKIIVLYLLLISDITYAQMQLDWAGRYNGPDEDAANGICVDDSGSVHVTGVVTVTPGRYECTTIKYNKYGDSLWVSKYQWPGNNYNIGNDIIVDNFGNVYVAASVFIIKYNLLGDLIWVRYDSAAFMKIALDTLGNVFASGLGYGKFVCVKYDENGNRIWKQSGISGYHLNDMILDKCSNIIITGEKEFAGTSYDYATIKYSNSGNLLWIRSYNGPGPQPSHDNSHAVASDNSGNVYVTGSSEDENSTFNCVTLKYDSSGNQLWLKRIYPPSNAYDIAVDELQNVHISSRSNGNNYTTKLDINGNIIWMRTYPFSDAFAINPNLIVLDSADNVYVSANSDSISNTAYAAIKYDSSGNQIFLVAYGYHPIGFNYIYDMVVDKKGSVYLTGKSNNAYGTVKFSEIITNISGNYISPHEFRLEQNYPNPFNPFTNLGFRISEFGFVTLKVYDALGKEVIVLVDEKKSPGRYEVEFDASNFPSGIYFYKLESGNFSSVRKMILLK